MWCRRYFDSRQALLLFLCLLWPQPDCCASQAGNLWQQAWPPDGSSREVRLPGGAAAPERSAQRRLEQLYTRAEPVYVKETAPPVPSQRIRRGRNLQRSFLSDSPQGVFSLDNDTFAPAPAPDQAAYLLVVLEVHGANIQPFGYQDRADFLVSLDQAIDDITLDNIELLAVEEFLPASGPSAESLMNLFGSNAVYKSPKAAGSPPPAPPPSGMVAAAILAGQPASPLASVTRASGRRRTLLQTLSRGGTLTPPPMVLTEPIVRVTLRISTTVLLINKVEQEMLTALQNSTSSFPSLFRAKGHDITMCYINSITSSLAPIGGPSIAPTLEVAAPASPGPPLVTPATIVRNNKSGIDATAKPDSQTDKNVSGTTIGISVGIGVPVILGAAGVALYLLIFRRRDELLQGVKAAKSRHWVANSGTEETVDHFGHLMFPRDNHFQNPLYPLGLEGPSKLTTVRETGSNSSHSSKDEQTNGEQGEVSRHSNRDRLRAAANRDGSVIANTSGEWGEGGELVAFSDLRFSRVIGEGSFGRVFLGKWRETTVAIKLLSQPLVPHTSGDMWADGTDDGFSISTSHRHNRAAKGASVLEELRKEARIMAVLRHPNIVMFLGACSSPPCMVTEFCARGSLLDILSRARDNLAAASELGWNRRLNMALEAAKGMLYLHSRADAVLHRDLKSANLLVDKHWRVKVADFNLSRVMNASAVVSSVSATNPRWMAPEVLAGKSYDCAADVYSFGIILWELLTWRIPWEDLGPWQVVILVVDQMQRPDLPADLSQLPGKPLRHIATYLDLMYQCWHQHSAQRPTFERIISRLRSLIEAEGHSTMAPSQAAAAPQVPVLPCSELAISSSPPAETAADPPGE